MPTPLLLKSPAKINLTLDIISRRADGYHDLVSLMCPIGVYDHLSLVPADGLAVTCDHPAVPEDRTNLAYRAARLLFDEIGHRGGVHITLTKNIPVGAGLGGGSGNAAAVLVGLNRHFGTPLTREALMTAGITLGADVPFFILGKPAVASGIGERLHPLAGLPRRWVVVVWPGFGISTREAYEGLNVNSLGPNLALTKSENLHKSLLLKSRDGPLEDYLHNDLEAVILPHHPELAGIKRVLLRSGAVGALMTGSGSCVFGVFHDPGTADAARKILAGASSSWRVYSAPLLTEG